MKPLLHDQTARQIELSVHGTAGGYIFHGPRSAGKSLAAREWTRLLNCRGDEASTCIPCRQLAAGSYPDFIVVQREDRRSISIEQIRQLTHALSLSSYQANGVRVVLIDDAHTLTIEAQNALLKLIEEPPVGTRFVLVAETLEALLPTVRSRLSAIYFAPVPERAIASLLTDQHGLTGPEAARIARLSAGVPGVAVMLATDETAANKLADLEEAAETALTAGLFERLLLAKRLADNKADLALWGQRLHRILVQRLTSGSAPAPRTSQGLVALERFRRGLEANLGPRVALERLMLEL